MTQQRPSWALGPVRTPDRKRSPKSLPRFGQIRTAAPEARFHAAPSDHNVAGVADSIGMATGYAAVFGQWAEIAQSARAGGNFLERVAPGAFAGIDPKSVRILYAHGRDPFIGERPLGPVISLREDSYGLQYAAALLPTQAALEILPLLQAGCLGSSYRFTIDREQVSMHPSASAYNPDALPERTILEATVFECGPCPFPAFTGATAGATPSAKDDEGTLTLSGNSTGSVASSREPRSTPPPSWALPAGKPVRKDSYLTKR